MLNRIYNRGASFLHKIATAGGKPRHRSIDEVTSLLKRYQVTSPAILWDGKVPITNLLKALSRDESTPPIFTFSLEALLSVENSLNVFPLQNHTASDFSIDGWVIASENPLDASSLAGYLLDSGHQSQLMVNFSVFSETTSYYSYVDYLGDKYETYIHINNYFRRCYGYPFPLPLKITLRDTSGKILDTNQLILKPDCSRVLTHDFFKVGVAQGYVEVEFEIHKKTNPFLHYMVDYLCDAHIVSNHQSGLGLHPAGSRFTRGYIPTDKDKTLEVSLFQKKYATPPKIQMHLKYQHKGKHETKNAIISDLSIGEIKWYDIKKLFPDISFSNLENPLVEVISDVPLHRPNYYYKSLESGCYYDTSHAGADLKIQNHLNGHGDGAMEKEEQQALYDFSITPLDIRFFILPQELGLQTSIAIGNDTCFKITKFEALLLDHQGLEVGKKPMDFDNGTIYVHLNNIVTDYPALGKGGSIALRPLEPNVRIPKLMNAVAGLNHSNGLITSTAANGSPADNVPLYFSGGPPNYTGKPSTFGVTEIFARGIVSEELETYYAITYPSGYKSQNKMAHVEIQILSGNGIRSCVHQDIQPNASIFLKLSDLITTQPKGNVEEYYTVWIISSDAHLYGQHILYRKRDHSVSLEHCYVGKFGY